eukprot:NODE_3145_length_824_cov_154.085826.p1 GENE.NODE_3145_length_824_cov_154.085826~~NODE_3145_length_824_cov_154.085826.p1  ORF type:complete len:230 (-),score=47.93 NODE_3145_length_824_cov_154.085826:117-806(-)
MGLLCVGKAGLDADVLGYARAMMFYVYAVANQPLVPCIYSELGDRSVKTMTRVGFATMLIVCTIYTAVGISGFLTWGMETKTSLLFNYSRYMGLETPLLNSTMLATLVAGWVAFPLNLYPCKFAILAALKIRFPDWFASGKPISPIVTVLLLAMSYTCAAWLPSLSVVLELAGATAGVSVVFLFPAGFHLLLFSKHSSALISYVMLIVGVISSVAGLVAAISDAAALYS